MPIKIAPSVLSADFARLGQEVRAVTQAGADEIHLDVMDGLFVPNITIGPLVVEAVKRSTDLPLDVHLMIVDPERYLDDFIQAGADILTVHLEASRHLDRTLAAIREGGARAGVSLNPATGPEGLAFVLDKTDRILVMSVNPGFGGQDFIPSALSKITRIREMIVSAGWPVEVEIDGGVNLETIGQAAQAGAEIMVAGSAVFKTDDYAATIAALRRAAE
ncbi:MAG: ribulose-phosphate 3-epimerase [Deltaproteobacteria bacterium]|nr:ribulose-phosphate 3-epimerase [Deltaproteobacteria bacterium]